MNPAPETEIDYIRSVIDKHFTVTDVYWTSDRVTYSCRLEPAKGRVMDQQFTRLRQEIMPQGFIPNLRIKRLSYPDPVELLEKVAQANGKEKELLILKQEPHPLKRDAMMGEFIRTSRCPDCGKRLRFNGRFVQCHSRSCGFGRPWDTHQDHYYLDIIPKSSSKTKSVKWNILFLVLTIISTILTGSMLFASRNHEELDSMLDPVLLSPKYLFLGAAFFSLPLMTILGCHEMGHYLMAKHHKVEASLPFFIPLPPVISPLGTMGAFISLREPMADRKALFDIGIAGPLAGIIVAIPVTIIGILLTSPGEGVPDPGGGAKMALGVPLLYRLLSLYIPHEGGTIHPTAFAGWVGLFITALNLLPASQLDGGHVARAVLGEKAPYLSYGTFVVMLLLSYFYIGWIVFALLVFFFGLRHPPPLNDITPLDKRRRKVGMLAALIFLISFIQVPMYPLVYDIDVEVLGEDVAYIDLSESGEFYTNFTINITNPGEVDTTYDILNSTPARGWEVTLSARNASVEEWLDRDDESWFSLRNALEYLPGIEEDEAVLEPYALVNIKLAIVDVTNFDPTCTVRIQVVSQNASLNLLGGTDTPQRTVTFTAYARNYHQVTVETVEESEMPILVHDFNETVIFSNFTFLLSNTGNFSETLIFDWESMFQSRQPWELTALVKDDMDNGTLQFSEYHSGDRVMVEANRTFVFHVTLAMSPENGVLNDSAWFDLDILIFWDYNPGDGSFQRFVKDNYSLVGVYQVEDG